MEKEEKMKKTLILSLIMVIGLVGMVSAQDLLVPTSRYPTIQAAIDAAVEGDTVIVADGTYTGDGNRDISFKGKAITVRSTNPNDPAVVAATIIDCNAAERWYYATGFIFNNGEDSNSILDGLTIINGYNDEGGGIYCYDSSPTIKNCIIKDCGARGYGGGIYCGHGSPTIKNCIIKDCGTRGYGGGIYSDGSQPKIINCAINNNKGSYGGGIYSDGYRLTIINCTISGNMAVSYSKGGRLRSYGRGGGIYSYSNRLILNNCILTGNLAGYGGSIYIYDVRSKRNPIVLNLTNCTIAGNRADKQGGGIYYFDTWDWTGARAINNNILWGNSDSSGTGQNAQIVFEASRNPFFCEDFEQFGGKIAYNSIQDDDPNDANLPFDCPDSHNIDDDPQFVEPGYWDPNGTPDDVITLATLLSKSVCAGTKGFFVKTICFVATS